MKTIPWRLIGLGVLAIAVGLLLWRITAWRAGFLERDQAVADLAALQTATAEREEQMAKDREADAARRVALSLALENARAAIEILRAHPIVSVVYREKPAKNGKCDDPRIGPDWIGVYNDTADAATRAVSRPD
jgi:hypothetical protein